MPDNRETLYSVLKMTREGKGNEPIENAELIKRINKLMSINDINKMKASEVKAAVIDYLSVVAKMKK